MKIRQRVAATAAIAAAAAITISACSSGGSSAPSSGGQIGGTLTGVFPVQFKSTYQQIAQAFEKKYPNVTVNFNYESGDMNALVLTQLQAGTAPDILTSFPGGNPTDNANDVIPLAAQGRILPLTASWASQIPAVWASSFNYKGKTYAYPGALQPLAALYNVTKLNQLGLRVPTTLAQVYQLCSAAKAKGVYAYAQGLGEAVDGPQMLSLAQMASLLYGPDPTWDQGLATGKATYPNSKWVDQFQIYDTMFKDGCFGQGALGRQALQGGDAVAAGEALGIVNVGAALAVLQTAAPKSSFAIAPMPATNDGKTYITALPGFSTTINAKAKNPATAQAFLDFMGTPEATTIFAKGFASVPVLPDSQYTAPAELKSFATLIAQKQYAPLPGLQPKVQSTLNTSVQSMLLGSLTPAGVAQQMQAAYQK